MQSRTDSEMTLVIHDECVSYEFAEEWSRRQKARSKKKKSEKETLTAGFEPTRAMPK